MTAAAATRSTPARSRGGAKLRSGGLAVSEDEAGFMGTAATGCRLAARRGYFLRCRILERIRRFLRPSLRRPFPDFLVPTYEGSWRPGLWKKRWYGKPCPVRNQLGFLVVYKSGTPPEPDKTPACILSESLALEQALRSAPAGLQHQAVFTRPGSRRLANVATCKSHPGGSSFQHGEFGPGIGARCQWNSEPKNPGKIWQLNSPFGV
jgi:hypothetical protein